MQQIVVSHYHIKPIMQDCANRVIDYLSIEQKDIRDHVIVKHDNTTPCVIDVITDTVLIRIELVQDEQMCLKLLINITDMLDRQASFDIEVPPYESISGVIIDKLIDFDNDSSNPISLTSVPTA